MTAQPKIVTFLTYDGRAEEALELYTSVFPNSKVLSTTRYGEAGPLPAGTFMTGEIELEGLRLILLNGGESFSFSQGFSLCVNCDTQEEIDEYWERLSDGGEQGPCGWLTDRFGVSWQIVPRVLGELLNDPDPARANRAMQAMLQMGKLEIKTLEDAARG